MDKYRPVIAILGIISLCMGSIIIVVNFTTVMSTMLDSEFLTPEKWGKGILGAGLLIIGVGIFVWLWKGNFIARLNRKTQSEAAQRARRIANEKGISILVVFAVIIIAILYYAIR